MKWLHEGFAWCFGIDFFYFGANDFPFQSLFVLPLVRRDPVLELQFVSPFCVILLWGLWVTASCLRIAVELLRQGSSLLRLRAKY